LLKNGKLQIVTRDLASPNGIALSPDEKYLYVNDISRKTVWRFDVLPDDTVTNRRLFVDMNSVQADGGPDGMKVDKRGNVYDSGPGGFWILSPEGKVLGRVLTPDRVSNLAFGDADGKGLYITLHNALYHMRLNIEGVRP
jgi:gluconolactonase